MSRPARHRPSTRRRARRRSPARRILSLALLVAASAAALSLLPGADGALSRALRSGARFLFGVHAWGLPALLALLGFLLLALQRPRITPRLGGLLLAFAGLVLWAHASVPAGQELPAGMRGIGGGVVGGAQAWGWRRLLGAFGVWVGVGLTGLGALFLLSQRSPVRVLEAATDGVQALVARTGARIREGRRTARLPGQPPPQRSRVVPLEPRRNSPPPSPPAPQVLGQPGAQEPGERPEPILAVEAPPAGRWVLPPLDLLHPPPDPRTRQKLQPQEVARALEDCLRSFGVEARCVGWDQGPVVTRYELQPAPGVKVQRITSLANDIALALAAPSVRIEAPIPGKSAVGIELPNEQAALVTLRELLEAPPFERPDPLLVALGKDIAGYPVVANLVEMPHLLIAGATGSGKSVMLNTLIACLLMRATPDQVRLVLIDPKRVELVHYEDVPHLLVPVVRTPKEAAAKLRRLLEGMERRYEVFARAGVRNLQAFNGLAPEERERALREIPGEKLGEGEDGALPYVVVVIDELADLMMVAPAEFEDCIVRLTQMSRATGIHLVVATQRPSVDVITGLIKANIPSRIAFAVSSMADSRTILDAPGAEKLLGRGDMLYLPIGASRPTRVQGAFVSDPEIERLVDFWKDQGRPAYDPGLLKAQAAEEGEGGEDELLAQAARIVVQAGYGSVSLLQRKMRIGYVRAARLVDQLEARGIVGPAQGANPREVLVGPDDLERLFPGTGPERA
ncbi:MAG: DNA translocase FtsK [Armatimonadota bacterium]|nr:DNA translocase FtsK [Armatimonadota bacterium]MDR7443277.1 DNA translocase FtsK [Armatimonadota bacterium]MDR7569944.1 DNA translocase FtsK [Armatimonadota bacterium]MDR7614393.1 DNA translocase FtsK [Armatimonadota bacterium]